MNAPRINLLPHREMKKAQRRRDFGVMAFMTVVAALAIVGLVGVVIQGMISNQESRNKFLVAENKKLDEQIKEVATLRTEIDALRARQTAVEDLQADRNIPVQILDELVRLTPEGIYLQSIKQNGSKLEVTGTAQTQERVSEYLRNLAGGQTLIDPKLMVIRAAALQVQKDTRKVFAFNLEAIIKRPEKKSASGVTAASGVAASSVDAVSAAQPASAVAKPASAATPSTVSAVSAPAAKK